MFKNNSNRPRGTHRLGLGLMAAAFIAATSLSSAGASVPSTGELGRVPAASTQTAEKPTIVLVHGAFADASGWQAVATRLMEDGYTVLAPPNPLRDLHGDSNYLKAFIDTIEGPVVLVGHSYGGAVITNAATGNDQVKSLVYIAAYALDFDETVGGANALGGHPEESLLLANVEPRPYPNAPEGDVDVYIKTDAFRQVFAADVPKAQVRFMAASQRPGTYASLLGHSGEPAWKTIPSWYLVASEDKAIPPTAERFMAERAGATTREIKSSHVPMISRPGVVTDMIVDAAN